MPSSPSRFLDSGSKHHSYCRKQKSLGVLFVSLYDRDGVELVGLDYAARQLGVERRRIYDIVNVMESVGVRSGPWVLYFLCSSVGFDFTRIGFGAWLIFFVSIDCVGKEVLEDEDDDSEGQNHDDGDEKLNKMDNASSSGNHLCKARSVEARKPAFRWLGTEGKPKTDTGGTLAPPPTVKPLNKRAFGTEITNVDVKRSRLCCTVSKKPGKAQMRSDDLKECNLTAQKQLNTKSGYVFGPFCPAGMTKVDDDVEGKGGRSTQDWEGLASSLRPQYHNQGLVHVP
ncbi:hypothetical protein BHE74_00039081 [Ensete ventricosum]|nr:hypothetical protein GW17_00008221 [Ensete ventricosum]RWW54370.1 hypothetical protein BHE74_00039081 [Ensete ventricosum]